MHPHGCDVFIRYAQHVALQLELLSTLPSKLQGNPFTTSWIHHGKEHSWCVASGCRSSVAVLVFALHRILFARKVFAIRCTITIAAPFTHHAQQLSRIIRLAGRVGTALCSSSYARSCDPLQTKTKTPSTASYVTLGCTLTATRHHQTPRTRVLSDYCSCARMASCSRTCSCP